MAATVAIAGSSGLIGSALVTALRTADHPVLRIVRRTPANAGEVHWDPDSGELDTGALQGVDAVVNLCGINIGQRRWSGAFKQNLRDSRITPTEVLATAVADAGVGVLVNASAVGYYGDTKDRVVDETGNESIGVRSVCYLPLTYDHRLVDGADAGRFVTSIRHRLEEGAFEADLGL